MKFPKHLTMSIHHNDHKNVYESILQFIERNEWLRECITKEDLIICIEKDELWEIQWYPTTPISFNKVMSFSLERCLELVNEIERKEGITNVIKKQESQG
jgi:hypothetical protein